ncbi:Sorting nexin-21, partial [Camelus dromedarius]
EFANEHKLRHLEVHQRRGLEEEAGPDPLPPGFPAVEEDTGPSCAPAKRRRLPDAQRGSQLLARQLHAFWKESRNTLEPRQLPFEVTTARLVKDTLSKYVRFLIAVMGQGLGIASWPRSPAVTRTLSAYTEACGISSGSPGQFPGPMVSFPLKAPAPELRRRDYRPPQLWRLVLWAKASQRQAQQGISSGPDRLLLTLARLALCH